MNREYRWIRKVERHDLKDRGSEKAYDKPYESVIPRNSRLSEESDYQMALYMGSLPKFRDRRVIIASNGFAQDTFNFWEERGRKYNAKGAVSYIEQFLIANPNGRVVIDERDFDELYAKEIARNPARRQFLEQLSA